MLAAEPWHVLSYLHVTWNQTIRYSCDSHENPGAGRMRMGLGILTPDNHTRDTFSWWIVVPSLGRFSAKTTCHLPPLFSFVSMIFFFHAYTPVILVGLPIIYLLKIPLLWMGKSNTAWQRSRTRSAAVHHWQERLWRSAYERNLVANEKVNYKLSFSVEHFIRIFSISVCAAGLKPTRRRLSSLLSLEYWSVTCTHVSLACLFASDVSFVWCDRMNSWGICACVCVCTHMNIRTRNVSFSIGRFQLIFLEIGFEVCELGSPVSGFQYFICTVPFAGTADSSSDLHLEIK